MKPGILEFGSKDWNSNYSIWNKTELRVKDCVFDGGHLYLIRERFNSKKVGVGNVEDNGNGEDHEEFEDVLPLKESVGRKIGVVPSAIKIHYPCTNVLVSKVH